MPIKYIVSIIVAALIGYSISPSYSQDNIFCSGFESCETAGGDLETRIAALEALVASLQSELAANTAADASAHHTKYTNTDAVAAVGPHFSGSHADLTEIESNDHHTEYTNADAVAAVGPHSPDYSTLLGGVTRLIDPNTSQDTLRFTNMNVQIVSGSGSTEGINGTGNLIIGYNELRDETAATVACPSDVATEFFCNRRTGSHNLIVGLQNNYSQQSGIVVGWENEIAERAASVSGGRYNTASGAWSSVSGGRSNTASDGWSSVSGGQFNTASGKWSTVSGGEINTASGSWSSVSGGKSNTASGPRSSVGGGLSVDASVDSSFLPRYTDADAIAAVGPHTADLSTTLLAGVSRAIDSNTSEDTLTFTNMNLQVVSGSGTTNGAVTGTGNVIIGYNETGNLGGDDKSGSHMLVIGWQNNYSSYGGMVVGDNNETSGPYSSISAGYNNTASGPWSSVNGGPNNSATGDVSTVSGGSEKTAAAAACIVGDNGVDC